MSPLIATILAAIVQGLPEIELAVVALIRMSQGQQLTQDELADLGTAMVAAHNRAQGEGPTA